MPKLLIGHWIESTRLSGAFFVPAVVSGADLHRINQRKIKKGNPSDFNEQGNVYD